MATPDTRPRRRRKVLRPRSVRGIKTYTSEEVYDLLAGFHGSVARPPHADPTSELVETILSQHTSDTNAERAFAALVDRYPTWQEVTDAPTDELANVIRSGGLARQKAPRIQATLRSIHARTGGYDIAFLATLPMPEAKAWLQRLPGVGPKTTGIVLSFAMDLPAMAVDTHIHRVTRRLGLIGPKVTAEEAHDVLEPTVAPERVMGFHLYLITHGRQVCKAQRPQCDRCVLAPQCPSRPLFERAAGSRAR